MTSVNIIEQFPICFCEQAKLGPKHAYIPGLCPETPVPNPEEN